MIKFIVSLFILIILISACEKTNRKTDTTQREVRNDRNVRYKITSDKNRRVSITMNTKNGTTQYNGIKTPYETPPETFKVGEFVYISAQNQTGSGSITVEITIDAISYKKETCYGEYCIATVSGMVE